MRGTTDIWFATFLKDTGHDVVKCEKVAENKGKYYFEVDDKDWTDLKMDFHKSAASRFKMIQISLRDLLY